MTQLILRSQAIAKYAALKTAYQLAFGSPAGESVLEDLSPFCREKQSCVVMGDRDRTYVLEGRREVALRIRDFLELTPEQLVDRYTVLFEGEQKHD